MSQELQPYQPKNLKEAKKAQRILLEKLLNHPDFTPFEIAALHSSLAVKDDMPTLTPKEATILKRNLPYDDIVLSGVIDRLQPYLNTSELLNQPPTFASRLRGIRDWIHDLTTENLVGIAGGTLITTFGFALTAGGLYGGYEILMHLPQMARPLVFGFGVGSVLVDFAGLAVMGLGASVLRDELKKSFD